MNNESGKYERRNDEPVWVKEDGSTEPYNHQDGKYVHFCVSPNWCKCSQ